MTSLRALALPLVLPLALSVVLATAGCGDGSSDGPDGPGDPSTPESPAATPTQTDDRSPDEALEDATDATLANQRFTIDSETVLETSTSRLTLTSEGRSDYDAVISDITIGVDEDGAKQQIEILADGQDAWVAATGATIPPFPDGATYLQSDAATLGGASTFDPEGLLGIVFVLRSGDEAVAGDTEEIDGTTARTYTFTVPYEDTVDGAGADADAYQSALSLTGAGASADLTVEVAIGEDDVVRRLAIEIDGGDVPIGGTYDLELSDVGAEVEAPEPPDAAEVATGPDAEALFAQLLR